MVIAAGICAVVGAAMAAGGIRLIRASEVKPGETSFVRAWSPRSMGFAGGWVLLFLGLLLTFLGAPMVYLTP